jgi:hypothetical protein
VYVWQMVFVFFKSSVGGAGLKGNVHSFQSRSATVKNIDAPMLTCVWQELEYRIDVCRVTRGAHIERL